MAKPVRAPLKILMLQFKSLGDAVLMIPALRAIRDRHPDCALHVLVSEAAAPLLRHSPLITRLWSMPRVRGRARLSQTWPVIRALRRERFDLSADLGSNDRGALLSLLCGAKNRIGLVHSKGFLGRRLCYTRCIPPAPLDQHETLRLLHVLSAWDVKPPSAVEINLHTDPHLDALASQILPKATVICHMGAGRPNRQWPVGHWAALHKLAAAAGYGLVFSMGQAPRERVLLEELRQNSPDVHVLPPMPDVGVFLAVLKRARAIISGDTGPMHFAAALGVPTIALFGPSSPVQWGPVGEGHQVLLGGRCTCDHRAHRCHSASNCLSAISPERVMGCLQSILSPDQ